MSNLDLARSTWAQADHSRDTAYETALQIRKDLRDTTQHEAYAWAAMTCGRIAGYRGHASEAEILLSEAAGRFLLLRNRYGEFLAMSHLSIPLASRGELDAALDFALRPLSSGVEFQQSDLFLILNGVALCYWAREEPHQTVQFLAQAYELVRNTSDFERRAMVIGNIAATLEQLCEWELALTASTQAWDWQNNRSSRSPLQLNHLGNMIIANLRLEKRSTALQLAESLLGHLKDASDPSAAVLFEVVSEAFAVNGQVEKADDCLARARSLRKSPQTPQASASTTIVEAVVLEARKDHKAAIALATGVLDRPEKEIKNVIRRNAAVLLSRAYLSIGRKSDSAKWRRFAAEAGRERLLGDILARQLRTSLVERHQFEPLTDQELTCLSLSARGQTSADIAEKLGIKPRTVDFHFGKVLRKLNAMNRQEAIAKAIGANLLRS